MARNNWMLSVGAPGATGSQLTALPDPSECSHSTYDVWSENTGRDLNGRMQGQIIAHKHRLDLVWHGLTRQEVDSIMSAIRGYPAVRPLVPRFWFQVEASYWLPEDDNAETLRFEAYLGDRNFEYVWFVPGQERINLSLAIIER